MTMENSQSPSSTPEIPKGAQPFDGSTRSWAEALIQTLDGIPGVLLVYSGEYSSTQLSAAWHLAVLQLTSNGQRLVSRVMQVLPASSGDRRLKDEIKEYMRREWKRL